MDVMTLSFLGYLLLSTCVGVYSITKSRPSSTDYLLASRSIGPIPMALSAVSTNNSGFMFIGLIGMTYLQGISAAWLMVGWILGDYIIWLTAYKGLRESSEKSNTLTLPSFIAGSSWITKVFTSLLLIIFLGTYTAAQFNAGSKALHVIFGWDYSVGAILGTIIVSLYCFAGGIRASIWTDVLQAVIMIASLGILCLFSINHIGGIEAVWTQLKSIDPTLTQILPTGLKFGWLPFILGWLAAGFGVIGQPHIIIRAMVLKESKQLKTARRFYFLWYIIFSLFAIISGICCRVLMPDPSAFDAELALLLLSGKVLPQAFTGILLAGLFAATMSTADSQLISCSGSLTHDLLHSKNYLVNKAATLVLAAFALLIALYGDKSVFNLVVIAWSGLACALGPLIFLRSLHFRISPIDGLITSFTGFFVVLFWRFYLKWSQDIYEVLPGMGAAFAIFFVVKTIGTLTKNK